MSILISIITISYNSERTIKETIESVLNQSYNNIEYIIIDGDSTDQTVDIIKSYESRFQAKRMKYIWISEKDFGISDAFNKGIKLSTGEIIGIINSDDWYEEDVVKDVANIFNEKNLTDILCGSLNIWTGEPKKLIKIGSSHPNRLYKGMSVQHPACFVRRICYFNTGFFDNSFKYAMDYEIMLRFYIASYNFYSIDSVLANFRLGGYSESLFKSKIECYKIKNKFINQNKIRNTFTLIYELVLIMLVKLKRLFNKQILPGISLNTSFINKIHLNIHR